MFRNVFGLGGRLLPRARRPWWYTITLTLLGSVCVSVAFPTEIALAKAPAPTFDPKDTRPTPKVSILTMGPGDQAFFKFGHNAIRINYPGTTHDYVYNFGTFQFDNPTLILDFLAGKFRYWLSVQTFAGTYQHYKSENRSLYEQELNLAAYQARGLADALRENAQPENRYYEYDYYRDNCSTRIRDALNDNFGGKLQERFMDGGQMTLRDHTLRATAENFWIYAGLDIAMGAYIDQPETRWGEMFLPERLMQGLQGVIFDGVHGSTPLVKEKRTLYEAKSRPPLPLRPPQRTVAFWQGGTMVGALFAFLGWEAFHRRLRWARLLFSALAGSFGLAAGTLGLLFVLLWVFTNHQVAFRNENILQCSPWALALPVMMWGVAKGRATATSRAFKLALSGLGAACLGLALKVLPFMMQQNYRTMAALIPVWVGLCVGLYFLKRRLDADTSRVTPSTELAAGSDAARQSGSGEPPEGSAAET